MSAGVCAVCHGAAPAFTGAIGERPEGRVIAVHTKDVHGQARHLVVCNECTRLLVGAWARMSARALPKRARTHGVDSAQRTADGVLECATCETMYVATHAHVCPGPSEEDDDGPQSE